TALMGDKLKVDPGSQVHFVLTMHSLDGAHPEVVRDGEATALLDGTAVRGQTETREFDYKADGNRHWLRVNVRGADGSLLILGNPIYLNFEYQKPLPPRKR